MRVPHPLDSLDELELRVISRVTDTRVLRTKTGRALLTVAIAAIGFVILFFAPSPEYGDRRPLSDRIGAVTAVGLGLVLTLLWTSRHYPSHDRIDPNSPDE